MAKKTDKTKVDTVKEKVNSIRKISDGLPAEKILSNKEKYIIWRSIPAVVKTIKDESLEQLGYDVNDELFMKLVRIKNKGDFCRVMKVGVNQPAYWEKSKDFQLIVNQISTEANVMKFKPDVDFSFTQKVIRQGDAHRVKLWKQLFEGWTEKTESHNLNVNMTPADLVEMIEKRNKEIRS